MSSSPVSSDRAIANLVASYAELTDTGDFAAVGRLFADADLTLPGGLTIHGSEALERLGRTMLMTYKDGTPKTKHVTTNLIIEVDEEAGTGTCRSYFTVFQALADFPLQPIASGRYRDRFLRCEGEWHFAERVVIADAFGDVSRHMRAAPGS